ncbi:MAG: hypothetical protein ACKVTZ_01325 [Bacteroidia bacterium]
MKIFIFGIAFLLSLNVWGQKKNAPSPPPAKTHSYTANELGGVLKTDFPSEFKAASNQDKRGKAVNVSAQQNGSAYLLNYMVHIYPLGIMPVEALSEAVLNNFAETSKSEIIESKDIDEKGYKGKAALLVNHEKAKMYEYRCFIINQMQVQMMVVHPLGYSDEANIAKFFNSFEWKR